MWMNSLTVNVLDMPISVCEKYLIKLYMKKKHFLAQLVE